VLTDAVGLLLLVRPLRGRLVRKLENRYRRTLDTRSGGPPTEGRVIEI
jgi:UPF0716 family protein affecting phage T7 exclusion